MMEVVRDIPYDFIGGQEVLVHPDPEFNQVTFMAKRLPEYGYIVLSREADANHGESGPIFYRKDRWEVDPKQQGTFWLSDTPDVPGSITWEGQSRNPRIVTWGLFHEIDPTGNRTGFATYIYNSHFDHVSDPARRLSAAMMMQRVAERPNQDVPVIVMGDINAGESSATVRYMLGEVVEIGGEMRTPPLALLNTFRVVHPDATEVGTFNGFRDDRQVFDGNKIDYILVTPEWRTTQAEIIRTRNAYGRFPTDHFPVNATIEFSP